MFIEQRLLDKVAYGTQCGVEFKTLVSQLRNGAETRKRQWLRPLDRFTVVYNLLKPADRKYVVDQFRACAGMFVGFRFRDPLDYTADQQPLGVATGESQQIQLTTTFVFGGVTEAREVYKPVKGWVKVFADGVKLNGVAVDYTTGIITLIAAEGAVLTWTGQFDKPVRFDTDRLDWSYDDRAGSTAVQLVSTDLPLTEYRILS